MKPCTAVSCTVVSIEDWLLFCIAGLIEKGTSMLRGAIYLRLLLGDRSLSRPVAAVLRLVVVPFRGARVG